MGELDPRPDDKWVRSEALFAWPRHAGRRHSSPHGVAADASRDGPGWCRRLIKGSATATWHSGSARAGVAIGWGSANASPGLLIRSSYVPVACEKYETVGCPNSAPVWTQVLILGVLDMPK